VTHTVTIPEISTLANKRIEELRNLTISKVHWNTIYTLGITLSDGKTCKAGTKYDYKDSHSFNPAKKITRIETIVTYDETVIA
jgi:hypothetical protein